MEAIFIALYPLVAICHVMAYLPQIKALASTKADVTVMPVLTWLIWLGANLISLGYIVFHLKDWMLCATTLLSTFLMCTVIGLILHNRHKQKTALPQTAE